MISILNKAQGLTGGQIAIVVIISILLGLAIALNIYLICLLKKRNNQNKKTLARQMATEQLQIRYDKLMKRLAALKDGVPITELEPLEVDQSALLSKINAIKEAGDKSINTEEIIEK